MRKILLFIFLAVFSVSLFGQRTVPDSLAFLFRRQLDIFPQEKVYLHTDKPYYLSGEKIWFRAYLADAVTHVPVPVSRYVYVELINPLDSVVTRVKIRPEEDAYYGHLPVPDDIPEGNYTLRAYTTFMQSQEEHYYYTKPLRIGDPQARTVHTETRFFFESDRRIHATFRFSHAITMETLIPQSVKVSVNEGGMMNVKIDNDGSATVNFTLPAATRQRTLLLEVTAEKYPYRQYIQVPAPDTDFDVSFYPEGGALMEGTMGRVSFKAISSDGRSAEVSGVVYDQTGAEVATFRPDHSGMGSFLLSAEKGNSYYAICETVDGHSKRFALPPAATHGYALSVAQVRNNLHISVLQPAGMEQAAPLYLLAHTRGMIHLIDRWDNQKSSVALNRELFPSGVLHLVLFDAGFHPVSERLVFIRNQDQAQVDYRPDRANYDRRSLVSNSISITDSYGEALTGSFSVSVTSDREVQTDSTAHILTHLLLTSDLRGHIENPAFYFQSTPESAWALDLLMLTQGWRRYDLAGLSQGRLTFPTAPLELGSEISGVVKRAIAGTPIEDVEVMVISLGGDYFYGARTDHEGRFRLPLGELPDSTRFMVSAEPKRGMARMNLMLDKDIFPAHTLSVIPPAPVERQQIALYADKAEQQYIDEGGIRITQLSAAVVTANRIPPRTSQYYSRPDNSITEEELEKIDATSIVDLLERFPGVEVWRGEGGRFGGVRIRGILSLVNLNEPAPALLLVDDMPMDIMDIDLIPINDIAQIDVLKNAANTSIFGIWGGNGVIVIHTKNGRNISETSFQPFHVKSLMPLGYQQPVAFYAPLYDTPEKRNAPVPDLRTTIHWQPVVQTDSRGVASFAFYTADETTSYTVIIEGIAANGTIIRKQEKIERR